MNDSLRMFTFLNELLPLQTLHINLEIKMAKKKINMIFSKKIEQENEAEDSFLAEE